MPRRPLENLTESMFYVLLALRRGPMCGMEIAAFWSARQTGDFASDLQRFIRYCPNSRK